MAGLWLSDWILKEARLNNSNKFHLCLHSEIILVKTFFISSKIYGLPKKSYLIFLHFVLFFCTELQKNDFKTIFQKIIGIDKFYKIVISLPKPKNNDGLISDVLSKFLTKFRLGLDIRLNQSNFKLKD
ncbi:hypothetical protein BpHYR1_035144 [Brachionus plicatilis]|uniref:Uncharacterized protein n=1 Tax=Brachionus plicatilis TaxID=10195 RepID=A0A3M7SEJ3_BRAPC|nr:hypothetical protein BpHYR1_035144 [Brachionus plicatilis]